MITKIITRVAYIITSQKNASLGEHLQLQKHAQLLRDRCNDCYTLEQVVDQVFSCTSFQTVQKRNEILAFLKILIEMQPRLLCEIGTAGGGTLSLLCDAAAPDARVLSIDINYTPAQLAAYPYLARSGQQITCLAADSHTNETCATVKEWLAGQQLDFLFIDGDHSLFGVSTDFALYAPHVRNGGIIALHDIVPDFRTRYGIVTDPYVGQVPMFWASLKERYPDTSELIEDSNQDGFGIGILKWQADDGQPL